MPTASTYPHIEADEKGILCIGKSRYQLLHLAAEHYHFGWSAEELLRQHPDLRPEEAYSALAYFYDHYEDMVAQMAASNERHAAQAQNQSLTREQLLQRRNQAKVST